MKKWIRTFYLFSILHMSICQRTRLLPYQDFFKKFCKTDLSISDSTLYCSWIFPIRILELFKKLMEIKALGLVYLWWLLVWKVSYYSLRFYSFLFFIILYFCISSYFEYSRLFSFSIVFGNFIVDGSLIPSMLR